MSRYKVGDKIFVNKHIAKYTGMIKEGEEVEIVGVDTDDMDLTYNIESWKGHCVWVNEIWLLNLIGIKV